MYATVSYISLDLLYIHNGDEPSENYNSLFMVTKKAIEFALNLMNLVSSNNNNQQFIRKSSFSRK